jgi:hypothetical protein
MKQHDTGHSLVFGSERRRSDDEVADLMDRIRTLVAEQSRLEGTPDRERREANRRELDRLQDRLAIAVRRVLTRATRSDGGEASA